MESAHTSSPQRMFKSTIGRDRMSRIQALANTLSHEVMYYEEGRQCVESNKDAGLVARYLWLCFKEILIAHNMVNIISRK